MQGLALPGRTASVVSRAVASLLRLADADLRDAEKLSSGRYPGNAPALLKLATERLVHTVLATEHGWPRAEDATDLGLIPAENPFREALSNLVTASQDAGPPRISDDGHLPTPTADLPGLRVNILASRAMLKNLAGTFEVDLSGDGIAHRIAPVRPVVVPVPKQAKPAPALVPSRAVRPNAIPPAAAPAGPVRSDRTAAPRPARIAVAKPVAPPRPEPHEVEGRAAIELKQGSASMTSTPFWSLMERWNIPDQAALDMIGHPGGMTKRGTRPRFKLVGQEAALLRSFQEIDAALGLLGFEPNAWLHQPIAAAPFDGASPAATLSSPGKQRVQDTLRYILQQGLRLSMANSGGKAE